MTTRNLLAVINPGHETGHLIRIFLESLPKGVQKVFESFGHIGSLEENLAHGFRREDARHFIIYRAPTFENLADKYFSSTPQAALSEIPDRLIVKVDCKRKNTNSAIGARETTHFDGTINEMVEKYRSLSLTDHGELLLDRLSESEFLRENVTKRKWLGLGRIKLFPTYVSVGIETPDGKYLLETTGAQGPYFGTVYL